MLELEKYKEENLVLIYQPGKVGSSSLEASISSGVNIHGFFDYYPCPPALKMRYSFAQRMKLKAYRFAALQTVRSRKNTKIILPVRDEADRNVSMFFQDFSFWYASYISKVVGKHKNESKSLITDCFESVFPHFIADTWFESEFKRLTGSGLEAINFDKARGFSQQRFGSYDCFFITTSVLSSDLGREAIEQFVGMQIDWQDTNRGRKKWYAPIYREFRNDAEFITPYRERFSNTLYSSTFFNLNE